MKTKKRYSRIHAGGFSRVEVLAVIAIVLFVGCTLTAVSGKAGSMARNVVCEGRLGALSKALLAYTVDYDGWIMPYATLYQKGATNTSQRWNPMSVAEEYWYAMLYAQKGIENRDIFFCPDVSASNNDEYKEITGYNVEEMGMGWTYGLRDWAYKDSTGIQWINDRAPKPLNLISRPSDFFLIADSVSPAAGSPYFYGGAEYRQTFAIVGMSRRYSWRPGLHLRHSDRAAAAFVDGHIDYKPMQYWCDLQDKNNWQTKYFLDSQPGFLVYDGPVQNEWRWINGQYAAVPLYYP